MPTILTKKSDTPGAVPATANLTNAAGGAELAVNTADKRLFTINSSSGIIEVGTNPSSLTCADASFTVARVGSLTISSLSLTNATFASATITNLTSTSTTISSALTLSGGTANGVLYLNGSKVATSGSALTFDGTNLALAGGNAATQKINIYAAGSTAQYLAAGNSNTGLNGTLFGVDGTGNAVINNTQAFGIIFSTSSTEQMRLTSTGLGIGTSSPAAKLDIGSGNLTFSSTAQRITGDFSNATLSNRLAFQSSTTNGNTTVNAIPNGTATQSQFVVHAGTDMDNTSRAGVNTSGTQAIFFADKTGTGTNLPMTFYTGGSERVRIDTSGNVGIGTASPTVKLQTNGAVSIQGTAAFPSSGVGIELYYDTTNGSHFQSYDRTASAWKNININSGTTIFGTAGSERMRIDSSGNVGIGGTASAFAKVQKAGTLPTSSNISVGDYITGTIPSGSTSAYYGYYSAPTTQATSFTCGAVIHYYTNPQAFGAGSTVTNQYGYYAESTLTGATNNYGFFSNIASGSNRWNFYAAGTAQNYFAGDVGVGRTPAASTRLTIKGQNNGTGTFSVYVENSTPIEMFKIRDDGTFYTGVASNSPYNLTTANAANVYVDSDGILRRSTSSLRYKSDVTDAAHGLADVLKLRSVTYKAKNDAETLFGGLIAEEVHEAGLTEFVAYDKEGRPDAIHYGNMVALLVKAVQELTARVAELEAK